VERLLDETHFDVVHTHESKAGIIGRLAARNRVPAVVHSVHISSFGPSFRWPVSKAFLMAERLCARYTDLFITVGTELRDMYVAEGLGSLDAYTVARSPVNVEAFYEVRGWNEERRRRARAEFDLPPHGDLVIAVGNLEKRKRQHLLISQLAPMLANRDAYLVLAGGGRERPTLEALARELEVADRVLFLGHVPRVQRLFGVAKALVHASTREGVPQVVVQALAAGLPVVATEVEGLREIPGAPVDIAPRSGAGLRTRVTCALDTSRPERLPFEAFSPWTEVAIEAQIEAFHDRLAQHLRLPVAIRQPA
jgi:glycosyltransferase involved in cell wall biosynthesis